MALCSETDEPDMTIDEQDPFDIAEDIRRAKAEAYAMAEPERWDPIAKLVAYNDLMAKAKAFVDASTPSSWDDSNHPRLNDDSWDEAFEALKALTTPGSTP